MASTTMTLAILTGTKSTPGSIKWMVGHESVYPEQAIAEAEALTYQRLRVREMVQEEAMSFLISTSTKALPTGFQQPIKLMLDSYGTLPYKREETFPYVKDENGDLEVGTPSCWTVIGSNIQFDVTLSEAMAGDLWFYGTPAALVTTNFLTDKYPSLFRHAILSRAYAHRNRADMYSAELLLFEKALNDANSTGDDYRYSQDL